MPAATLRKPSPALGPDDTANFTSKDGTSLYSEWFDASERRGVALVLHGYAEHCGRYHEVARVLADAGFPTLTFDFRGHGKSDGQRGHVGRFRDYLDDMEAGLRELDRRANTSELPVLLVGHSNGSLVALRFLADVVREPTRIRAAVVSSPFLGLKVKVPAVKGAVGKLAGRYAPTLSLPNDLKIEHLTHDPDKIAARKADTLCNDNATARWFTAALRAHDYVSRYAVRIETPTLWLVAGGDRIADPAAARAVHARLRAPSRYREFPQMHHEVFNEIDRNAAFGLIREFADEHFPE